MFATNVVTADQYIAIVLPGRMFKGAFEKRGLAPVVLSRTIGASGTPTSALIPWNSCGAYMAATLGVTTLSYRALCGLQLREPAADDRTCLHGVQNAARAGGGEGSLGTLSGLGAEAP